MAASDILIRLAAACALAACGTAHGQGSPAAWTGVWSGTIGALPIVACLDKNQERWYGAYYYLKHLLPIRLDSGEGGAALTLNEKNDVFADTGAAWSLALPLDGHITGSWQGNGRTLPVKLARVAGAGKDAMEDPCRSEAFNKARETPGKLSTRAAAHGKIGYRIISLDMGKHLQSELSSFQLNGAGAGVARANATLHKALLAAQADVYECGRNAMGRAGEYSSRHEPQLIKKRWMIVAHHYASECGGAHPNHGISYSTWDLEQGVEVDPWRWFTPAAVGASMVPKPMLAKMLKSAWEREREPDCVNVVAAADQYWFARPAPGGMAFTPSVSHADSACIEEVIIPYARLLPLMTAAGKDAVASFKADVGR